MPATPLQTAVDQLIDGLNALRNNSPDADQQAQIQVLLNRLFPISETLLREQLEQSNAAYREAVDAVDQAQASAKEALRGLRHIADAVRDGMRAAEMLEQVIGGLLRFLG